MPNKDIKKRREAYKRWAVRHPEQHRNRSAIQKMAVYYNPVVQVCGVKGCKNLGERHHLDYTKPKEIVWRCKKHHEEEHHRVKRLCSVKSCGRKHWAKGLCLKHLKRSNPKKYNPRKLKNPYLTNPLQLISLWENN